MLPWTALNLIATERVYDEILRIAAKTKASLIVAGAHKADLKDNLLGPNAASIVRHANCWVSVVR
ncbi:universal stress protein [Falsihalocynthiibacter sp. BN13B15]|uniref:universal stress protein n=1 Tax=Falsihalocynthiibacter sp. BN13B15 TaxID=3240871 RepID=UPI00350EFDC7